jgi:hypothetical protein
VPIPPVEGPPADGAVPAAPSGYADRGAGGPSVAVVPYDPRTGKYMSGSGQLEQQTNLVTSAHAPTSWKDLMPT